ncbi:MAG: radical SAM protein [Candidatus Nezhaarchaeota archaeon]|nr:radical SAM protein [Candidatus Nezhaarchaeota archaeon]
MKIELGLRALKSSLALKEALRRLLEQKLDVKARRRSLSDGHARRKPRPCGLTIHTCVGCPFACVYCYIDDLGFPRGRAQPYSLNDEEWLLAITSNPFFLPGPHGTYLSFGSVCEPLHSLCFDATTSYLSKVRDYLSNPCQLSTKASLSEEAVEKLAKSSPPLINVLVTIVTLSRSQELEPGAPSPQERLETLRRLRRKDILSFLFLRPLLPGLEEEIDDILSEAKQAGAIGVVVGGLRLSQRIYSRLRSLGIDVPRPKGGLVDVPQLGLKELVIETAREKSLTPFRSACCATTFSMAKLTGIRVPCAGLCFTSRLCTKCPVECTKVLPTLSEEEVVESSLQVLGLKPWSIRSLDGYVEIKLESRKSPCRGGVELLQLVLRRRIRLLHP